MSVFKKKALAGIKEKEKQAKEHRILLVDDELDALETLAGMLSRRYDVATASNGAQALEMIRDDHPGNSFQLVISDQRMPGMTGVELLAKSMQVIPNAKRIILSGFADVEAVISSVNEARIYEFMLKPVEGDKLRLTVQRALEAWDLEQQNSRMVKELEAFNRTLQEKVAERTRTLRFRDEEILRAQNQLIVQQKMASLGTLTAGIAHEIKNPLNFINSFAELTQELLDDLKTHLDDDPNLHPELTEILNDLNFNAGAVKVHGRMADTIINNMLQLAQGNIGKRQPTDLNNLVREYTRLSYVGKRAADHGIEIHYDLAEDLPKAPTIAQGLGRVWLNLTNNAIEALTAGKKEVGEHFQPSLQVITRDTGDHIEVTIRDNGPGIPENIQGRIFDPFFTTKPTGTGNIGLGLSICYDIVVMQHLGEIKVSSEPNRFTAFTTSIPKT
ncbi:MAG: ATP-binding protein [Acidobacteriota bacterium]|nr:ATP-binding protein [Acidobacteriota bacterium]